MQENLSCPHNNEIAYVSKKDEILHAFNKEFPSPPKIVYMKEQPFTNNIFLIDYKCNFYIYDENGLKTKINNGIFFEDYIFPMPGFNFDFDCRGNIFFCNLENHKIRIYDPAFQFIEEFDPEIIPNSVSCGILFFTVVSFWDNVVLIFNYEKKLIKTIRIISPRSLCFDKENPFIIYILGERVIEIKTNLTLFKVDLRTNHTNPTDVSAEYCHIFMDKENKLFFSKSGYIF